MAVKVEMLAMIRASGQDMPFGTDFESNVTEGHNYANADKGAYCVYLLGPDVEKIQTHMRPHDKRMLPGYGSQHLGWSYESLGDARDLFGLACTFKKMSAYLLYIHPTSDSD